MFFSIFLFFCWISVLYRMSVISDTYLQTCWSRSPICIVSLSNMVYPGPAYWIDTLSGICRYTFSSVGSTSNYPDTCNLSSFRTARTSLCTSTYGTSFNCSVIPFSRTVSWHTIFKRCFWTIGLIDTWVRWIPFGFYPRAEHLTIVAGRRPVFWQEILLEAIRSFASLRSATLYRLLG